MLVANTDLHALNEFLAVSHNDGYEHNSHNFCMTFTDALAIGITTVEEAQHHSNLSLWYYEGYKDVHGVKARWCDYTALPIATLETMLDSLDRERETYFLNKDREESDNAKKIEELIEKMLDVGANDRETAIRWYLQTFKLYNKYSLEEVMFSHGINPYSKFGQPIMNEMCSVCEKHSLWQA